MPIIQCFQFVWEKATETEALHSQKALKCLAWQMNIAISITGNAFILPYLQAHVFLFLSSLKKPFFSGYLVPSKGSGNQPGPPFSPPLLWYSPPKKLSSMSLNFTVPAEWGGNEICISP